MITIASDTARPADRSARIREYYACFNERRFADAAAMFTDDAVLEQIPFQRRERGGAAYQLFAELWTGAFPDIAVVIEDVAERQPAVVEVQLAARGTHTGNLALGGCLFKPTGVASTLRVRELLEFRGDQLAASFVSFDLQELAQQLARVDDTQLLMHLSRLRFLEDQLRANVSDPDRRSSLIDGIGRELDAARRVVRPYFTR